MIFILKFSVYWLKLELALNVSRLSYASQKAVKNLANFCKM